MATVSPIPVDPNDPRNAQYLAKQGQALAPMPQIPTPKSPEELQLEELQAQADQSQLPNLQLGQAQLENLQGQRQALLEQEPQMDLSALYGLTDAWTGSNLRPSYNAPQTPESRQAFASKLQDQITAVQSGLTKEQQSYLADKIKRQLEQNNKKAERELKEALAKQEQLAKEEQRRVDRENKVNDMLWQQANKEAAAAQHADLLRELARINAAGRGDMAAERADRAREQGIENLSKRLDQPTAAPMLQKLADVTSRYEVGELPGVGPGQRWIPQFFKSDEGQELDQLSFGLTSSLIKAQSGLAASEGEVRRKQRELGMSNTSSPEAYMRGLINARDQLYQAAKQAEAGYKPEVVQEFRARGGLSSDDIRKIQFRNKESGSGEGWTSSKEDELSQLEKARGK